MSYSDNLIPISIAKYAKAIKKFAIASILMIIIGLISTSALLPLMEQVLTLDPTDEDAFMEAIEPIMGPFLLYGFLAFVGLLIYFVVFIQYMMKLNQVSKATNDINLRNVFRIEIANIIFPVVIALFVANLTLFFILSMIPTILSIVAIFYLEKWFQTLPSHVEKPPLGEETKSIFLMMKIGMIAAFILAILGYIFEFPGVFGLLLLNLGDLLYVFGFWKLGQLITAAYPMQNLFSQTPLSYGQQQYPSFNTTTTQFPRQHGQNPPQSSESQTFTPQTTIPMQPQRSDLGVSKNHCPFCGAPKIDSESRFCSTCGQKML